MSVFAGVKFFLSNRLSMEDHRNLRKIIADQGGQIVEQPGDSKCFHVLPLFTQPDAEAELLQYQKELLPIIGPPCVVEAAERRYQLPDREAVRRSPLFARFLLGAVVCSTAISADMRSALVQRVLWMGGEWHMDFTNTVTHMLAYMPGSEKYKVAVQRGRPALVHPSWVTECWKQQALVPIDQFPVPPFTGLTMTVTGFPHDEREKMKRLCMQHGGQYSSDLNRSCTHLIVERPGSKKHQYALLWGSVKVVHPRWLYESVEKRACLKEEDFPVLPAESQSQSSANQDAPCSSGTVDSDSQLSISMADPDEAERTRSHSTALKRPRSPAGAGAGAAHSAESKKRKRAEPPAALPVSMSTSRRHDRSGGGDDEEVKSSQQPMARRQRQPRGEIAPSVTQGASMLDPATLPPFSYSPFESPSLFKGFSFLCKGFDSAKERSEIKKLVEDHGGVVTFDNPTGASTVSPVAGTYVLYELAPHGTPGVSNQPLPTGEREPPANIVVTPQWVQRCIQDERVMDPMEMPILFTPLPHPLPLPKPPLSYLISVTGFAGVDRENLKGLIESMGFSYTDRFTKKNTHLICKEASGDKFVKAKEWQRGAIVSAEWLTQSASKGRIQDTKRFAAAQTEDVLSVNRKFEERQRSQAKINKLNKDRSVICISDPKPPKERSSTVKSGRRRSSAATSSLSSSSSTSLAPHGAAVPSEPFLSDVTILVSKKLEQQQSVLHDLVASMGGTFAYMFDPSISHLIFEGRADTSKELRLAKGHKHIKIVSPLWLHACKRHNAKVDEIEYPHTMNPRMTLGLDFKSPSLVAVKKEKRDPDNNHHPAIPQPAAIAVVKREVKEEEEDLALAFNVDNYYSQQSHHHHHHQEERDEDLFVPPTQQPSDSASYRVPLTLQHHRPQPTAGSMTTREQTETRPSDTRDESWAVPERSRRGEENECDLDEYGDERRKERKRSRERSEEEEGEEEDEPLHRSRREGRKANQRKEEREVVVEEYDDEESTRTNYEVVVGCTPDVRQGGGTTVPGMPPYFWQAGATTTTTTTTTIKTEEPGFRDDDNGEERRENEKQQQEDVDEEDEGEEKEEKEDEEEESEGSGHSAIIQQLLQKNKASSTGQMRISPLLRMQPKTSSFMLETISRTVARSDTMLGKEYNRSLSKFSSSTMFKPPMSKDILPSQTEEEEDPAPESSERRYADEPDSQVVKYAFPLEQAAQDLLFSLAEESMDTEGGASATESASERESRKRKTGAGVEETVQAKAATDASEHQRGSETKRRRKDEPKTDEDEAPPKDPMDGKEVQQQVTESPWSSRGSGNGVTGSGPNRASGSLDRSLAGKSYIFMFTAFNSTTNKLSPTYVDTVRELGGHVLETKFFHPRCTHVVMAEPVRTEKSLAACAAGIWLLKASYLEECVEKNAFVDESRHIWTEQDTDNEVAQLMIASSRRWRAEVVKRRLELQQAGKKGEELLRVGAFAGWRVLVVHYADVKRGEGLKRLIEAGGGEVCPTSATLPSGLTMAFFNDRPDESSDLVVALRRAKVPVLTAEYIGDFLTRYPQPPVDRYNFTSPAFAYQRRPRGATGATANSAAGSSVSLLGSGGGGGGGASAAATAASTAAGVKKLSTRTVRK
ncbi:Subunit of DNA polymerase II [Acanthamoeba castellanii str. Neff]|uniref:Subunit of DNA polymerase II n=1 Tax=Acanthamoeba castellanii (strain ATCC 30010 / Neff) TaxID=1257118 RepID=L8HKJ6_ACACF|nr:Subunit of DNA polymerase II [Acanthamoeba castellanii str. Neff]ELR25747.1 Subunit of DNA polymerase II [Acanthamoeba castellanii str. Neff]